MLLSTCQTISLRVSISQVLFRTYELNLFCSGSISTPVAALLHFADEWRFSEGQTRIENIIAADLPRSTLEMFAPKLYPITECEASISWEETA